MTSELEQTNRHAFDTWTIASPWRRCASFFVDLVVCIGLTVTAAPFLAETPLSIPSLSLLCIVIFWIWDGIWLSLVGRTPGRMLFQIRVFSPRNNGVPDPLQVATRVIAFWFSLLLCGLGLTPILYRKDRRGWADSISESVVLGPKRDLPSAYTQRMAQNLFLIQVFIVAATCSAIAVSLSLKTWKQTQAPTGDGTSDACMNPKNLLTKPAETLFALSISPAWASCWDDTKFQMERAADSEVFWAARLARLTFNFSIHNRDWSGFEERREIQRISAEICRASRYSECQTSERGVATALQTQRVSLALSHWLTAKYTNSLNQLFTATGREERLALFEKFYNNETSPLVRAAIQERIWAEVAFLPESQSDIQEISSSYSPWRAEQVCWMTALRAYGSESCSSPEIINGYRLLQRMKDMTAEEANYAFNDAKDDLSSDFQIAFETLQAARKKDYARLESIYTDLSELSPLHSWIEQVASKSSP